MPLPSPVPGYLDLPCRRGTRRESPHCRPLSLHLPLYYPPCRGYLPTYLNSVHRLLSLCVCMRAMLRRDFRYFSALLIRLPRDYQDRGRPTPHTAISGGWGAVVSVAARHSRRAADTSRCPPFCPRHARRKGVGGGLGLGVPGQETRGRGRKGATVWIVLFAGNSTRWRSLVSYLPTYPTQAVYGSTAPVHRTDGKLGYKPNLNPNPTALETLISWRVGRR